MVKTKNEIMNSPLKLLILIMIFILGIIVGIGTAITPQNFNWITALSSALLTPTVAILGAWIAGAQWKINQRRLQHELFDRRIKLYQVVAAYIANAISLGDVVKGDGLGLDGYEFQITGGSDKCGFPMRKGIQDARKRILVGGSVGFCGKKRRFGKKKVRKSQKGLLRKRTVCGERVSKIIRQVNVKVVKAGKGPLTAPEAAPVEAPAEESK